MSVQSARLLIVSCLSGPVSLTTQAVVLAAFPRACRHRLPSGLSGTEEYGSLQCVSDCKLGCIRSSASTTARSVVARALTKWFQPTRLETRTKE